MTGSKLGAPPAHYLSQLQPQSSDYTSAIDTVLSDLFERDYVQDFFQSGIGEAQRRLRPYITVAGIIVVGLIILQRVFKFLLAGGFLLLIIVYAVTHMVN